MAYLRYQEASREAARNTLRLALSPIPLNNVGAKGALVFAAGISADPDR